MTASKIRRLLLWASACVSVWGALGTVAAWQREVVALHVTRPPPRWTRHGEGRVLTSSADGPVWCALDGDVTREKMLACEPAGAR